MGDFWKSLDSEIKQEEFTSTNVLNHEIQIKHEPDDSENVMKNLHEWNTDYKSLETIKAENVADLYSTSVKVDCSNGYVDEQLKLKGQVSFDNGSCDGHRITNSMHEESGVLEITQRYDDNSIENIRWLHCRLCEYKAKRKQILAHHFLIKHEIVVWFQCQFCEYRSQLERNLRHHLCYKHNDNAEWYTCHSCEYKTQSVTRLRNHVNCKHNVNNMWLHCDICGYKAQKISTFTKHVEYEHNKFNWHCCELCEYKAKRSSYLKKHHREKHGWDAEQNHRVISDYKTKIIKNNYGTKIKIRLIKPDYYSEGNKQTIIIPVELVQNVTHIRENLIDAMVYGGNVKSEEIDIAEQYNENIY